MQQSSLFLMTSLLYGTGTTVFGGYVAARLARAFPYFNALAVGAIGIVLGLLLASEAPWWADALAYLPDALDKGWSGELPAAQYRAEDAALTGHYFNLRKTTIYGGSNEIQKNIISQMILGL